YGNERGGCVRGDAALRASGVCNAGIAATAADQMTACENAPRAQSGHGDCTAKCLLLTDTVEKRFCGPECATLIQNRGRVRNFDSNSLLFGFDCCVWADR